MLNLTGLIAKWGYWGIFLVVVAGSIGVPMPEETVLVLSGYLVWKKELWLPAVLAVGILSAICGDNAGYWLGRRYGSKAIACSSGWVVRPEKVDRLRRIVLRYGAFTVFSARFLPGLRFMAGPLTGSLGMPFLKFFVANVLGAALYVPLVVGVGYAVGYGFGGWLEQFRNAVGKIEHIMLAGVIVCTLLILGSKAYRFLRNRTV